MAILGREKESKILKLRWLHALIKLEG